jgi:hypothetical protein
MFEMESTHLFHISLNLCTHVSCGHVGIIPAIYIVVEGVL